MTEADDLRAATREAHETLKDLRTERRAVEELIKSLPSKVRDAVGEIIKVEVEEAVRTLGDRTEVAMRKSVRQVEESFEKLANLYLGRTHPGGKDLETLTKELIAKRMRSGT